MKNKLSLIFKLIVIISSILGTILSCLATGEFMTGGQVFLYFTIQSNIWIMLVCVFELISLYIIKKEYRNLTRILKLMFTIAITLTGFVFTFVLAPTLPNAWSIQNVLTHVVVPVFAIVDYFFVAGNYKYSLKENLYSILPPLYYLFFASIGYVCKWDFGAGARYPYFFLNWGSKAGAFGFTNELPFMGVMYWVLALLIFLFLISTLYTYITNKIYKKNNK